jgi:hypothetical protein
MVQLNKTYEDGYGNRIKIFETFEEDDSEGRSVRIFKGHVIKAIKNHEERWLGKTKRFTETGKWQKFSDQGEWSTCNHSEHNLKKEVLLPK